MLKWKASHHGVLDEELSENENEKEIEDLDDPASADKVLGVKYSFSKDDNSIHIYTDGSNGS